MNKKKETSEVISGINPVFEALRACRRKFREVLICKEKPSLRITEIVELAQKLTIPVNNISPSQLASMAETDFHQGAGAVVSKYRPIDMEMVMDVKKEDGAQPFLLLLDSVVDPHNLGALIRTAICSGIDAIMIPKDRAASPTPSVSRASAGAMEHASIVVVTNMVNAIKDLKKNGVWIAGLDASADQSLYQSDLSGPLGIVIGGEDKGVRPLVRKHCDFMVSIPQKGAVNSLNASVAGAIVMYEAFRQRSI